jgi:hypothetical protein
MLMLACCGSSATPSAANTLTETKVDLPSQILGLHIVRENVRANLRGINGTYLKGVGLFSFREKSKLLRATLQVGAFNDVAPAQKAHFRDAIVGQLGSSVPVELRLSRQRVFLSAGTEQNIFSWFDPKGFYVLSVRGDYPFSRTLVRRLVELHPLR